MSASGAMAAGEPPLLARAREILPDVVAIRRSIHRRPELGLDLPNTQAIVVAELQRLGLAPRLGTGLASVTTIIGPDRPGRTVVLRADMDALPLPEETGLPFASEVPGVMHACGHDTHVAQLLGAARLLVERSAADPGTLPGPVLLMFQPGEEGFFGARMMLAEGLLDGGAGTRPLTAGNALGFAIHTTALYPVGQVHLRPGPMCASVDNFMITLRGRGGHASQPHTAIDPIPAAAQLVLALQTAVAREVDVFDPAVLTIGRVAAGTTYNVIPETAVLEGTYRTLSHARRAAMGELLRRVTDGVAAAHGVDASIHHDELYPVTRNDPAQTGRIHALAAELVGVAETAIMDAPLMAGEDWSYVADRIPSVMADLGARPRDRELAGYPMNHSGRVVFDESAMAVGAALYAKVALEL